MLASLALFALGIVSGSMVEAPLPVHVSVESSGVEDLRVGELRAALLSGLDRAGITAADNAEVEILFEVNFDGTDTQLRVTASRGGDLVAEVESLCEVCGAAEEDGLAQDLAARLGARLDAVASEGTILVEGNPGSAEIWMDGELVGDTPLVLTSEEGPHELEVRAPGYETSVFEWGSQPGVRDHFEYNLATRVDDAAAQAQRAKRAKGMRIGGWSLVATSVAALGAGATLWAIDGRPHQGTCSPEDVDINGLCPKSYATQGAGIALTAGAVVAAGAGVSLLVLSRRERDNQSSKAQLRAGVSPTGAWVSGRF